ncbi:MAG: SDR family NAD(P)-dependent oxidoreductase, partial [Kiritimatiellae bacterium]|nr:SDR family NAD(P)-dependent oxidoreductase [Kiritimatiellia bacterium]
MAADMELKDKVALVTGGAKRLGREIALALAREGCDIVVHYRSSREEADGVAAEIRDLGRQAWCVCGDFSNVYGPDIAMNTAWDLAGWVDILVNNAAVFSRDALEDAPVEKWEELWRVNTLAPVLLARRMQALAAKSDILPGDYCGRIVNVLDRTVSGLSAKIPYWITKKSLEAFTAAAALARAPRFPVNAVAPGPGMVPEDPALRESAGLAPLAVK